MVGAICLAGRETRIRSQLLLDCLAFGLATAASGTGTGVAAAIIRVVGPVRAVRGPARGISPWDYCRTPVAGVARVDRCTPIRALEAGFPGNKASSARTTLDHDLWGAEQGLGVATRVNTWGVWCMVVAVAWRADPLLGAAVGLIYRCSVRGMQPLAVVTRCRSNMTALTYRVGN